MIQTNKSLLYEKVVAEIYKMINRQEIKPGERFPTERELAEKWDISRNVLREAFHILESRGVVYSKQGRGRFLRQLPELEQRSGILSIDIERYSLKEIYEVRQVLEMKIVELIVKNASDEDINEIEDLYLKLIDEFEKLNLTSGEFELHKLYANKTKNLFLKQMIELVLNLILDMMSSSFNEVILTHSVELYIYEHGVIIEAMKERDVEKARKAMFSHIESTIDMLNK